MAHDGIRRVGGRADHGRPRRCVGEALHARTGTPGENRALERGPRPWPMVRPAIRISASDGQTRDTVRAWARACGPVPRTARTVASGRARSRCGHGRAAAVRSAVRAVASIRARGRRWPDRRGRRRPGGWAGPVAALPGKMLTSLDPRTPRSDRLPGMAASSAPLSATVAPPVGEPRPCPRSARPVRPPRPRSRCHGRERLSHRRRRERHGHILSGTSCPVPDIR